MEDISSTSDSYLMDYVKDGTTKCSAVGKEKSPKFCGVCGDVAKSFHFGGLCCDSCKAFFRRTVQSQSWETFLCVLDGECEMNQNRRSCQACRYELCKKIGMDPSLVMNIEERKALMFRKLERRKQQLLKNHKLKETQLKEIEQNTNKLTASVTSEEHHEMNMDWDDSRTTELDVETEMDRYTEENSSDDCLIIETLSIKDQDKIKGFQKLLRKALSFPEFPKHYYEEGADVTEHLFFVFCKGMGKFFSLVPEFRELEDQDQRILLKDAVAKAIFIFGAHQFQEENECWPRRLLSPRCTFPTITLFSTEKFIDDEETFLKMKTFMRKFCRFFDDEVVTILSLMIAVFDVDFPSLVSPSKVVKSKEIYTHLLESYLQHQNSSMSVILFTTELWNCFSEVQDLTRLFQRGNSKDKETKSLVETEDASFASSLHNLGEDPKMPPKKAFSERVKVRGNSYSPDILLERNEERREAMAHHYPFDLPQLENEEQCIEDDEITMVLEDPRNTYFTVTQDHNYQKLDAKIPQATSYVGEMADVPEEVKLLLDQRPRIPTRFEKRTSLKSSLETQQMPGVTRPNSDDNILAPNYADTEHHWRPDDRRFLTPSSRHASPALLIPVTRTRSKPYSENPSLVMPQNLQSYSNEVPIESPHHSRVQPGFSADSFDLDTYSPLYAQPCSSVSKMIPSGHNLGEHEYISPGEIPSSQMEAFSHLGLKAVPIRLPSNNSTRVQAQPRSYPHFYPEHHAVESEMQHSQPSYPVTQQNPHLSHHLPAKPKDDRFFRNIQTHPASPRQSPMSSIYGNRNQQPNQDDQQLVQAVQNVLPPRLVKHLMSRLGAGQREQL